MTVQTDNSLTPRTYTPTYPVSSLHDEIKWTNPVMLQVSKSTAALDQLKSDDDSMLTRSEAQQQSFTAPIVITAGMREVSADSTPLQVWEGTVIDVDRVNGVMQVNLDAKLGQLPRHTGEINLEWVSEQDLDLVHPGAVFYLTLFKRTKRGSVENSQELRFRRRPSWSAAQLKQIDEDAALLLSKMKALPTSA